MSLNPTELSVLATLCKHLDSSGGAKASQSVTGGLDLAVKLTTIWSYKDRLPGLDILRLLAVAPATASYSHHRGGNLIDVLETGATDTQPPAENHVMMAIRAFANLFSSTEGRLLAASEFTKIQSIITPFISSGTTNRNLLVAVTTLYINYAVYFTTENQTPAFDTVIALLDTLSKILSTSTDAEAIYRAIVATGTLLTLDEETKSAAKEVYGIERCVQTAVGKVSDARIRNVAREIGELLG